jgi:chemotaxis protein CheC
MKLTDIEGDIAKEIINIGLGKAADSMAFLTQEKVFIRTVDLQILDISEINTMRPQDVADDERFVLTTNVEGEMGGVCYLIFTGEKIKRLHKKSLPESILNNPDKLRVMGYAILLEMDNIISAAVITQFSNFFKYKMYGGVPHLAKIKKEELNEFLTDHPKSSSSFIYFHSEFSTGNLDVNPEFIWFLDEEFLTGVKSVIKNDDLLMKMESSK